MSTWEGRMAERAATRATERARAEAASAVDEHAGHHAHLIGTAVRCSCGQDFGVTTVAFPDFSGPEEAEAFFGSLECRICGERGLVALPSLGEWPD